MLIDSLESSKAIGLCLMGIMIKIQLLCLVTVSYISGGSVLC